MSHSTLMEEVSKQAPLADHLVGLDHVAIAVRDLDASLPLYRDVMGFEVKEQRTTEGRKTAMRSAVLERDGTTFVLVQGTTPESQVTRYVKHYGPGVQHVALEVKDLPRLTEKLEAAGMGFSTTIIQGAGIRQIFTTRDSGSGMMYELIERQTEDGHFTDESVRELFRQLEEKDHY